jgi:hypothetical protein
MATPQPPIVRYAATTADADSTYVSNRFRNVLPMTCTSCTKPALYLLPAGGGVCRDHRVEATRAQAAVTREMDRLRAQWCRATGERSSERKQVSRARARAGAAAPGDAGHAADQGQQPLLRMMRTSR